MCDVIVVSISAVCKLISLPSKSVCFLLLLILVKYASYKIKKKNIETNAQTYKTQACMHKLISVPNFERINIWNNLIEIRPRTH